MDYSSRELISRLGHLNADNLILFIETLRESGYKVGVDQYIAIEKLLLVLASEDKLPQDSRDLGNLIAPLLCTSPLEQENFQFLFRQWIETLESPEEKDEIDSVKRFSSPYLEGLRIFLNWKTLVGLLSIAYTIFLSYGAVYSLLLNADLADYLTIVKSAFIPLAISFLVVGSSLFNRFGILKRISASRSLENLGELKLPKINEDIFSALDFSIVSRSFRTRDHITSNQISIDETIDKTIQNFPKFTPVYSSSQVPAEYLFLISRQGYGDHQAAYMESIRDNLVQDGAFIKTYYFGQNPQIFTPSSRNDITLGLREIISIYEHYRVVIFSDVEIFFSQITGELESWIKYLLAWENLSILTPKSLEYWGDQELEVMHEAALFSADLGGLQVLSQRLGDKEYRPKFSENMEMIGTLVEPFPEISSVLARSWVDPDLPEKNTINEMLEGVRDYLGMAGFGLFSACAVFPTLDWALTLYLREELSFSNQSDQNHLSSDILLKISRLPWFRYGYMPDWIRLALINKLSNKQEQEIRSALRKWLEHSNKKIDSNSKGINISKRNKFGLLRDLKLFDRDKLTSNNSYGDYICLDFILNPWHRKLAVQIPKEIFSRTNALNNIFKPVLTLSFLPISVLVNRIFDVEIKYYKELKTIYEALYRGKSTWLRRIGFMYILQRLILDSNILDRVKLFFKEGNPVQEEKKLIQRQNLAKQLNGLSSDNLESLFLALDVPKYIENYTSRNKRISALLEWVEGPTGRGTDEVIDTLNSIKTLPLETSTKENESARSKNDSKLQDNESADKTQHSKFTRPLSIRWVNEDYIYGSRFFELAEELEYDVGFLGSEDVIRVPMGYRTDFNSIPRIFRAFISPISRYGKAAILHNYLCDQIEAFNYQYDQGNIRTREEADVIFLEAMTILGVASWKRSMLFSAVRIWGIISEFRARRRN